VDVSIYQEQCLTIQIIADEPNINEHTAQQVGKISTLGKMGAMMAPKNLNNDQRVWQMEVTNNA
jgi:hypothetical protein